jgi:hypothetical protein
MPIVVMPVRTGSSPMMNAARTAVLLGGRSRSDR